MADILIRNVPPKTAAALRARAKRNGRTLQAEALSALEQSLAPSGTSFHKKVRAFHHDPAARFDTRAALEALREDRSR